MPHECHTLTELTFFWEPQRSRTSYSAPSHLIKEGNRPEKVNQPFTLGQQLRQCQILLGLLRLLLSLAFSFLLSLLESGVSGDWCCVKLMKMQ